MSSKPVTLSCYIRVQNEARMIGEVVRAALKAADEVVVVDGGSTDGTPEIAAAAGARVIVNPWPGNGFQKRVGEEACASDWLLDIDADEVVTDELAAEIRALFAKGEPEFPVWELTMVLAPLVGEPWWGFGLTPRRKLYDRRHFRMPEHRIWDQLDLPKGTAMGHLKGRLLHHAFRNVAHAVDKYNGRSTARARDGKRKSMLSLTLRLWFGLPVYIFKPLVSRGNWRGGTYGMILAVCGGFARWLRDAKMYEAIRLERQQARK